MASRTNSLEKAGEVTMNPDGSIDRSVMKANCICFLPGERGERWEIWDRSQDWEFGTSRDSWEGRGRQTAQRGPGFGNGYQASGQAFVRIVFFEKSARPPVRSLSPRLSIWRGGGGLLPRRGGTYEAIDRRAGAGDRTTWKGSFVRTARRDVGRNSKAHEKVGTEIAPRRHRATPPQPPP